MPLGQELTKSVPRSPLPASPRHMPGNPRREMAGRKPGQLVLDPAPAVKLTYSLVSAAQTQFQPHPTKYHIPSPRASYSSPTPSPCPSPRPTPPRPSYSLHPQINQQPNPPFTKKKTHAKDTPAATGHKTSDHPPSHRPHSLPHPHPGPQQQPTRYGCAVQPSLTTRRRQGAAR